MLGSLFGRDQRAGESFRFGKLADAAFLRPSRATCLIARLPPRTAWCPMNMYGISLEKLSIKTPLLISSCF
jgi:hypothetical protein